MLPIFSTFSVQFYSQVNSCLTKNNKIVINNWQTLTLFSGKTGFSTLIATLNLANIGNLQHHISGAADPCKFMDVKFICALPVVAI